MASVVVPDEFILDLYDYCDTELFTCTYCGKKEPDDVEFSECSRCIAATYCSRDCQGEIILFRFSNSGVQTFSTYEHYVLLHLK